MMTQSAQTVTTTGFNNDFAFVVELEAAIEKAYNSETTPYTDQEIEIDGETDAFGTLYRVWSGRQVIGTFYRSPQSDKWIAEPFYRNGEWARFTKARFGSSEDAIAHIAKSFEGEYRSQNSGVRIN